MKIPVAHSWYYPYLISNIEFTRIKVFLLLDKVKPKSLWNKGNTKSILFSFRCNCCNESSLSPLWQFFSSRVKSIPGYREWEREKRIDFTLKLSKITINTRRAQQYFFHFSRKTKFHRHTGTRFPSLNMKVISVLSSQGSHSQAGKMFYVKQNTGSQGVITRVSPLSQQSRMTQNCLYLKYLDDS